MTIDPETLRAEQTPAACCSTAKQSTCCEASAKTACCGNEASGSCGCQ